MEVRKSHLHRLNSWSWGMEVPKLVVSDCVREATKKMTGVWSALRSLESGLEACKHVLSNCAKEPTGKMIL